MAVNVLKHLCLLLITAFGIITFRVIVYPTQFLKFIFSEVSNLLGCNAM